MRWLEGLANFASEAAGIEQIPPSVDRSLPDTEPRRVTVTIRYPTEAGDPGLIEVGTYTVKAGILVVMDEGGVIVGQRDGSDPLTPVGSDCGMNDHLAREILRTRRSGFNRRLEYPRLSIV